MKTAIERQIGTGINGFYSTISIPRVSLSLSLSLSPFSLSFKLADITLPP